MAKLLCKLQATGRGGCCGKGRTPTVVYAIVDTEDDKITSFSRTYTNYLNMVRKEGGLWKGTVASLSEKLFNEVKTHFKGYKVLP